MKGKLFKMNSLKYIVLFFAMALFLSALPQCDTLKGVASFIPGDIGKYVTTALEVGEKLDKLNKAYEKQFTAREEYYIGRTVAAKFVLSKKRRYTQGGTSGLEKYINEVGHTVAMASRRPGTYQGYRFILIKGKSPNAFAIPSGYIFLATGMLKLTRNEDQLAGVLAHEVSHVVLKHPTNAILEAKREAAVTDIAKYGVSKTAGSNKGLGKLTGVFSSMIDEIGKSVLNGYDAQKEKDADINSVELLINAGYNPKGLSRVLSRLKRGGGVHGNPKDRAKAVDAKINSIKTKKPKRKKARTRRFKRSVPKKYRRRGKRKKRVAMYFN